MSRRHPGESRRLRTTVTYAALVRLGPSAQRGWQDDLLTWQRVTDAVLDTIG
jgi:hypothetical protein